MKNTKRTLFKIFLVLLICMGNIIIARAQTERLITGRVTDTEGEHLAGVNVFIRGTTTGTATNEEGRYELTVPSDDAVLVFSFIGNKTVERTVNGDTTIDVVMEPDAALLSEVVYIGYMTQRKADITGSVSIARSEDLEKN